MISKAEWEIANHSLPFYLEEGIDYEFTGKRTLFGTRQFKLLRPFKYYLRTQEAGTAICFNAGFQSDGASAPKPLWGIVHPMDSWILIAAVVHDYMYRYKPFGKGEKARRQADQEMKYLMEHLGAPCWKRKGVYVILRVFGFVSWRV
jgi:hypothetical protein